MSNKFMVLDIQRFADGGSGEGAGTGEGAAVAQPQTGGDGATNATGSNASVAGEQSGAQTAQPDLSGYTEEQFEELIEKNSALKKVVGKKMSNSVGKRLAQERAKIQDKMKGVNNVVDKLLVMHGAKNIEELNAKLDGALAEEFAIKNGVDEKLGRELISLRTQKLQDDRNRSFYEGQRKAEMQLQQWKREADEVKGVYADFDLNAELENPDFRRLISAPNEQYRIPMKQVYELIHHDELIKAAEKRTADAYSRSVNANLSRPSENGTGNQSAVSSANDVSKLTKKERAELAKRAARGERITFN